MMTREEELKQFIEEELKEGYKYIRVNHSPSKGEEVEIDIEEELFEHIHPMVDLLSPYEHHERSIFYLYTEALIQFLPILKEEKYIHRSLLSVVETMLLALDYMTHERFTNIPFTDEHRNEIEDILSECFEETKTHHFSVYANRPVRNESNLLKKDKTFYCLDKREEKSRIFMAVVYKKTKTKKEHMGNLAKMIAKVNLKPNRSNVSYQEMLEGKTDHGIHEDLIYYINRVKLALSWLINSTSWRSNELYGFDEWEIKCKLGIR